LLVSRCQGEADAVAEIGNQYGVYRDPFGWAVRNGFLAIAQLGKRADSRSVKRVLLST
jgi:hypothetical protein